MAQFNYAGFEKRAAALLADSVILGIFNSILNLITKPLGFSFFSFGIKIPFYGSISIIGVLTAWIYFAAMESSSKQATLGKLIMKIKVVDINGRRLSFLRATGRHFGKLISAVILGIGFVMIAFTEKKQGLHDKIANCLVVES